MSLEYLPKPVKWLDEQVLRQYTKLTKKWEDKGRSRYSLAHLFNLTGLGTGLGTATYNIPLGSRGMAWFYGMDLCRNFVEPSVKSDITSGTMAKSHPILYIYEKVGNITRLPFFGIGCTYLGKGAVNLIGGVYSRDSLQMNKGLSDLLIGWTFFGISSSNYIKDSNPKLLAKASFWKTAYAKIKEGVKNLLPKPAPAPAPQPVPVRYSTLEDCV